MGGCERFGVQILLSVYELPGALSRRPGPQLYSTAETGARRVTRSVTVDGVCPVRAHRRPPRSGTAQLSRGASRRWSLGCSSSVFTTEASGHQDRACGRGDCGSTHLIPGRRVSGHRALVDAEPGRTHSLGGRRAWVDARPGGTQSPGGRRAWVDTQPGRMQGLGGCTARWTQSASHRVVQATLRGACT